MDEPNEILSTKKSNYNSKMYMHSCNNCNTTKNLHTHHKLEQAQANENGFIETDNGPLHKNKKCNLEILCVNCLLYFYHPVLNCIFHIIINNRNIFSIFLLFTQKIETMFLALCRKVNP